MWEHVYQSAARGYQQDVHFKFLHRVLPTNGFIASRFRGRGFAAANPNCSFCPPDHPETQFHAMQSCPLARDVLIPFMPTFRALTANPRFRCYNLLTNYFSPPVTPAIRDITTTLYQIILHTIWTNRNSRKFYNIHPHINQSIATIRRDFTNCIRDRLRHTGLAKFRQLYCTHPDILQTDDNGKIYFTIKPSD